MNSAVLQQRVDALKSRLAVRSFQYRQRHRAAGVWFRLRRVLTDARLVFAIDREQMQQLIGEGFVPESVGAELEPSKEIVFVPAQRIAAIADKRPLAVRLSAELLAARHLILVRF